MHGFCMQGVFEVNTSSVSCALYVRELSTACLQLSPVLVLTHCRCRFWEVDATKHVSVKKGLSVKRGMLSVNERCGKDFYRKGNSVKRSQLL